MLCPGCGQATKASRARCPKCSGELGGPSGGPETDGSSLPLETSPREVPDGTSGGPAGRSNTYSFGGAQTKEVPDPLQKNSEETGGFSGSDEIPVSQAGHRKGGYVGRQAKPEISPVDQPQPDSAASRESVEPDQGEDGGDGSAEYVIEKASELKIPVALGGVNAAGV